MRDSWRRCITRLDSSHGGDLLPALRRAAIAALKATITVDAGWLLTTKTARLSVKAASAAHLPKVGPVYR